MRQWELLGMNSPIGMVGAVVILGVVLAGCVRSSEDISSFQPERESQSIAIGSFDVKVPVEAAVRQNQEQMSAEWGEPQTKLILLEPISRKENYLKAMKFQESTTPLILDEAGPGVWVRRNDWRQGNTLVSEGFFASSKEVMQYRIEIIMGEESDIGDARRMIEWILVNTQDLLVHRRNDR